MYELVTEIKCLFRYFSKENELQHFLCFETLVLLRDGSWIFNQLVQPTNSNRYRIAFTPVPDVNVKFFGRRGNPSGNPSEISVYYLVTNHRVDCSIDCPPELNQVILEIVMKVSTVRGCEKHRGLVFDQIQRKKDLEPLKNIFK